MFDSERQFPPIAIHRMVASESRKLSAEERRREVYETHRHRVFAVGFYMTANELEAEVILADTFTSAFGRQTEPDADGVDRALLGELERRFSLDAVASAISDAGLMLVKTANRRTDMEEALRMLPALERLVFLLKDVEGYPAAKIACLLDRPEREVQRTLFSARIRMRNALAAAQAAKQSSPAEVEPEAGVEAVAGAETVVADRQDSAEQSGSLSQSPKKQPSLDGPEGDPAPDSVAILEESPVER